MRRVNHARFDLPNSALGHRLPVSATGPGVPYWAVSDTTREADLERRPPRSRVLTFAFHFQRVTCRPGTGTATGWRGQADRVCRVSTLEQNAALQHDALTAAGCWRVFTDRVSGVTEDRPELTRALEQLRDGDTLVVWRLDRLGRSLRHRSTWSPGWPGTGWGSGR